MTVMGNIGKSINAITQTAENIYRAVYGLYGRLAAVFIRPVVVRPGTGVPSQHDLIIPFLYTPLKIFFRDKHHI
jgi:hypothetical protein